MSKTNNNTESAIKFTCICESGSISRSLSVFRARERASESERERERERARDTTYSNDILIVSKAVRSTDPSAFFFFFVNM